MKRILIASTEKHSGKSLLSVAMGRSLQERGARLAYMKPISFEVSYATGEPMDRDVAAIRSLLSLGDDLNDIAPVPLEGPFLREAIESGDRGFRRRITKAFRRITRERDVVLIEGRSYLGLGAGSGLSDLDLANLLRAHVLLLTHYDGEEAIDRILCALRFFEGGPPILGVVLKDVPAERSYVVVEEVFVPFLADRGAEVLGIVPYDRNLQFVCTEDIATHLGGRVLTDVELDQEVHHFVVGAMGAEASLRSFRRTPELAVITGGDRVEIQQAALDVSNLRCLILTGNHRPTRHIVDRANERGVPIILAGQNTMVTAALCGEMLERVWMRIGTSLNNAVDYVRSNIDIDRILEKANQDESGSRREPNA
jgi:BioD-like phosphotransacetylase family protein